MIIILLSALLIRLYGINWDQGLHLHPDERMLIMVADSIHFFNQLNPHFFNYGSLPIYLLKGLSQLLDSVFFTHLANYSGMLSVGRILSVFADLGTIFLIYKISNVLFRNKKISLASAFLYSISFFPIQNSHFFVVDIFLTFFITSLVYLILKYLSLTLQKTRLKVIIEMSITFAAMLATKFTALIFLPVITLALIIKNFKKFKPILIDLSIFCLLSIILYLIFMPYAFFDYNKFSSDLLLQTKMNSDPYIFPYTLQYVGTIPYIYYLKNIFLWGLGPIISLLSVFGLFTIVKSKVKIQNLLIFFLFYLFYFLIIGHSAVKFMRYMLPIYPFLTILAGYGLIKISNYKFKIKSHLLVSKTIAIVLILLSFVWTLMFVNIYSQKHTRVAATEWILNNIPKGATLAVEHWDDRVPVFAGENYNYVEMTLYDQPDDERKWLVLDQKLKQADYIIIASNRLYVPLQKLNDCTKFKLCYPKTAEYYNELFKDQLGFKKVAEFAVYPQLTINKYQFTIDDQSADESFTVYDHPKLMIFKRL